MARGKINKSEEIRETFEVLGHDARPKDVIAVLAKRRIKVAPAAVSNIKAKLGNGVGNGRARGNGHSDKLSLASLVSAKKFIDQLGGLEKAQTALSALANLS